MHAKSLLVSISCDPMDCRVARQAPLSLGFFRQEHWSGLPFPPPGDLLNPGMEHESLTTPALAGGFFPVSTTWEAHECTFLGLYLDLVLAKKSAMICLKYLCLL